MSKLTEVSAERLRDQLHEDESPKAVKRLMVALAYKDGVGVDTLSDRYDIPTSTIYHWLDRFEEYSIEGAITDESRPGRPAKLSGAKREAFYADLEEPPTSFGYDADEWSPELAQRHLEAEYDVSYSLGHTRRLLRNR